MGGACGVHILGSVGLATPDGGLTLGSAQRRLLALLVAAGRGGLTKQQLYRQLYPTTEPSSGEQSAVMRVHRLRTKIRNATGTEVITSLPRYRLDPSHCSVDWWDLETAVERADVEGMLAAGAGWGEPFAGLRDAPTSVVLAGRQARETQHRALCLLAVDAEVDRLEPVASELVDRFAARSYDERLAVGAATALYRVGRLPEAVAVIVACRRELRDTHGLQAGHRLDEIELLILNNGVVGHDPTGHLPSPAVGLGPPPAAAVRWSHPDRAATNRTGPGGRPFVGRRLELERLQQLVAALGDGDGVSALIESPPGGGKTTLVDELARRCAGLLTVRIGRTRTAGPGVSGTIYGVWLDAFPELLAALVELQREHPVEDVHHRFWHRVRTHAEAMATDAPLLLILEDLPDADGPSMGLLRSMVELGAPARVMLLVTSRTGEVAGRLPALDHHFDLPALSLHDISDLVAFHHPGESPLAQARFATQVHRLSRGNALVAAALSRDAAPGLDPTSLTNIGIAHLASDRDRIRAYLDRLLTDRPMTQILAVASMIGFEFESTVLAEILVADPADIRRHLAGAAERRLCREVAEDRWQFDHLLVADYFDYRLGVMRPLVAGRLARHRRSLPRAMSRLITWAGPELETGFVVDALDRAATSLEDELAFEEATVALEHLVAVATEPIVRIDTLIRLAAATCRSGAAEAAVRHRAEAFAAAVALDDHDRMVAAALAGLPSGVHPGGDPDRLQMLEQVDDRRVTTLGPEQLIYWRLRLARLADRPDLARRVIAAAETMGGSTTPELRLEQLVAEAAAQATRIRRGLEQVVPELPLGPVRAGARFRVLRAALSEQDHDAAGDLFDEVRAEIGTYGSTRTRWAMELLAAALTRVGLRDDGPDLHHARRLGVQFGLPDAVDHWKTQAWFDRWLRGQHAEALELIEPGHDRAAGNIAWHAAVALGSAHQGDESRARREAEQVRDRLMAAPESAWSPPAAALLAETAARLDDRRFARTAAETLTPRSGQALLLVSAAAHFGPVDHYLALTDGVLGRDPRPRLDRAAAQATTAGSRFWSGRIAERRAELG
ncbi:MAG: AAA family ATPase [Acidimicrobiales bacterium]